MAIDRRAAPRRELRFADFAALDAELGVIEGWVDRGEARATANWTVGQNLDHCAMFLECSLDGFPAACRVPGAVRFLARTFLKPAAIKGDRTPPGMNLPKAAAFLLPPAGVSDRAGLERLRRGVRRVLAGERMTHPSPLLGPLTHEEWSRLQLNHVALHLGFVAGRVL